MPLSKSILEKISQASKAKKGKLDLKKQNPPLNDEDIAELVGMLKQYTEIIELDLRDNNIGFRGAALLAENKTRNYSGT